MKRRDYEKPTMIVVELKHRMRLLIVSGGANVSAQRNSYGDAISSTWGDEE